MRPYIIHLLLVSLLPLTAYAQYSSELTKQETQRELALGSATVANVLERPLVQQKFNEFQSITADILNQHPQMAQHYIEMEKALAQYESMTAQ